MTHPPAVFLFERIIYFELPSIFLAAPPSVGALPFALARPSPRAALVGAGGRCRLIPHHSRWLLLPSPWCGLGLWWRHSLLCLPSVLGWKGVTAKAFVLLADR
jgi:hypothetical protein